MPSSWHDAVTRLITEHPELGPAIAIHDARFRRLGLPVGIPVSVGSPAFNDRISRDFYADAVVMAGGNPLAPEYGLIAEAQQAPAPGKLEDWPRYAAAFWLSTGKPEVVLVLCPDDKVARWYAERQPIATCLPGYAPPVIVIGPGQIPVLTDPTAMAASPALAVLSVAAHGADHPAVLQAFREELLALPQPEKRKYYEFAHQLSGVTVRKILEDLVTSDLLLSSPIAIENYTKGQAEGLAEGKAEGEADAILLVLKTRGLTPTDTQRTQITGCTDLSLLRIWVTRAVTATLVDDLFD
jgi:hypothetical protein